MRKFKIHYYLTAIFFAILIFVALFERKSGSPSIANEQTVAIIKSFLYLLNLVSLPLLFNYYFTSRKSGDFSRYFTAWRYTFSAVYLILSVNITFFWLTFDRSIIYLIGMASIMFWFSMPKNKIVEEVFALPEQEEDEK